MFDHRGATRALAQAGGLVELDRVVVLVALVGQVDAVVVVDDHTHLAAREVHGIDVDDDPGEVAPWSTAASVVNVAIGYQLLSSCNL